MIIKSNKIILGDGKPPSRGYVIVEGSLIKDVCSELPPGVTEEVIEADLVCPGFIDIHNHGLGGTEELLEYWLHDYTFKKLPAYGCTATLATITYPKDFSITRNVVNNLKSRLNKVVEGQAVLMGLHSEGPIVSDCGGLPCSHAESMSVDKFRDLLEELGNGVKVMTISPSAEAKCDYARLKMVLAKGIVPALGHDKNASEEDIIGALRVCAAHNPPVIPHMTHMFNVSSFSHRLPSLVNFGLAEKFPNEEQYKGLTPPTVEIIGDLVHVASLSVSAALKCRKPENVAFITDAVMDPENSIMSYAGNKLGLNEITHGRRAVVIQGTSTIAGSCTNMLQVFHNLVKVLYVPVEQAVQMMSATPARIVRIDHVVGSLQAGKRADIVLMDSSLNIKTTIIAGKIAYQ